jgi:hypothetical protein
MDFTSAINPFGESRCAVLGQDEERELRGD